jgi:hypothetical protein
MEPYTAAVNSFPDGVLVGAYLGKSFHEYILKTGLFFLFDESISIQQNYN